jgi:diguanylate cyclase (GGDEF)-like protein
VLPETDADAAERRAEDIRSAIGSLDLNYMEKPLGGLTASLGTALFPHHSEDTDSLLRAADEALYAAKGAGRYQVVMSSAARR